MTTWVNEGFRRRLRALVEARATVSNLGAGNIVKHNDHDGDGISIHPLRWARTTSDRPLDVFRNRLPFRPYESFPDGDLRPPHHAESEDSQRLLGSGWSPRVERKLALA
jgi:hypothetical protein